MTLAAINRSVCADERKGGSRMIEANFWKFCVESVTTPAIFA